MQLREFEKSTDELIKEYETVDIDQLLAELEYEFNRFMQAILRDTEDIETLLSECEPETFEDIVNRIWKKEED